MALRGGGVMSLATQIQALGPTAWWRLNDPSGSMTAADSSGNGHTAGYKMYLNGWTTAGTVTIVSSPGNPGPSVQVPGSTSDYAYTDSGVTPTTIEVDMYSTVLGDFFFGCNSSGAGSMARIDTRSGQFSGLATTSSWSSWSSPASGLTGITASAWHHLVISISGGAASLTIDGVTANSIPYSADGSFIGYIGDGGGGDTYFCNVLINGTALVGFGQTPPPGFSVPSSTQFNAGSTSFRSSSILGASFSTAISGSFSVAVKVKSPGSGTNAFVSSRTQTDYGIELRSVSATSLGFLVGNGTSWIETGFTASVNLNDGNWHDVVAVATPTGAVLYVDGASIGSTTWATATPLLVDSNHDLIIGQGTLGINGNEACYGNLSDVAIFPVALSSTQVADLYSSWKDNGLFAAVGN